MLLKELRATDTGKFKANDRDGDCCSCRLASKGCCTHDGLSRVKNPSIASRPHNRSEIYFFYRDAQTLFSSMSGQSDNPGVQLSCAKNSENLGADLKHLF